VLDGTVGAMDEDLARATARALTRDRAACAAYGRRFTWAASAQQFEAALTPMRRSGQGAHPQPVAGGEQQAEPELAEQPGHPAEAVEQISYRHWCLPIGIRRLFPNSTL
jgi:hypothetical protein